MISKRSSFYLIHCHSNWNHRSRNEFVTILLTTFNFILGELIPFKSHVTEISRENSLRNGPCESLIFLWDVLLHALHVHMSLNWKMKSFSFFDTCMFSFFSCRIRHRSCRMQMFTSYLKNFSTMLAEIRQKLRNRPEIHFGLIF